MPENISGVPAGEKCFSLDIPFYRTSGRLDGSSVLAHTFRVARDSKIILWTAKISFHVELVSIRPIHEKTIFRQTRM
jgi:hypothetical protein